MKEYVVYLLKSILSDKHYVGYTENLISRFRSHNELSTKGFTTRYRPWEVIYVEIYKTKKLAMNREKFLKSGKGREWMKKILMLINSKGSYPPEAPVRPLAGTLVPPKPRCSPR